MQAIIHIDEIFLKGSNQPIFYKHLEQNLEQLLVGVKVRRIEGALWLENVKEEQLGQLALIPGFANYAEAVKVKNIIVEIKKGVDEIVQLSSRSLIVKDRSTAVISPLPRGSEEGVAEVLVATGGKPPLPLLGKEGVTFRISSERSFKNYPLSSKEIEKEIGEYVRLKYNWQVSLNNSDLDIHIAVGKTEAYIYGNTHNAVGGLPTSSSGKVLTLLSGGIDSPVAAYKMMTRGAEVGLIHFQNQTQVTEEVSAKIFDLAKVLSRYQPEIKLFMVPFANLQKQIIMNVPAQYRMIVTRRIFNKIADRIARQYKYLALATGDSLGQVASQTLENMSVVYQASTLLKLAPLIGTNKKDIIDTARTIGTLDISIRPYEDCCSLFVAKHPSTKTKLEQILKIEENIDPALIDNAEVILYPICQTK